MLQPFREIELPSHYGGHMSSAEKLQVATSAAEHVAQTYGLTPVAATIVGSELRGVDRRSSDTDVLVLVAEKMNRSIQYADGSMDGQVHSLDLFVRKLPQSVPFREALNSPFLVTVPKVNAYLQSLRVNHYEWLAHAQVSALRVASRLTIPVSKRARSVACTHHMVTAGSPLCPHSLTDPFGRGPLAARWLEQVHADNPRKAKDDDILDVTNYLRGGIRL